MRTYDSPQIPIINEDYWKERYETAIQCLHTLTSNKDEVDAFDLASAELDYKNLCERDELLRKLFAYIQKKFPKYDPGYGEKAPEDAHPQCSYWWNGVCRFQIEKETETEFHLTLVSYVAGGNYDSREIVIPKKELTF